MGRQYVLVRIGQLASSSPVENVQIHHSNKIVYIGSLEKCREIIRSHFEFKYVILQEYKGT